MGIGARQSSPTSTPEDSRRGEDQPRQPHVDAITPSTWQYIRNPGVAKNYDTFFDECNLFAFDSKLLSDWFDRPGRLLDLGCGTGRHLLQFAQRGFDVTGVDLSAHMLAIARRKLAEAQLTAKLHCANMLEVRHRFDRRTFDYACSMFSTFGLVAGARNRHRFLRSVHQILRPGGLFALHAHNRGRNIFSVEGQRHLLGNLVETLRGQAEWGDKYLRWYRGIEDMFVHVFSHAELDRTITRAGFRIRQFKCLNHARDHALRSRIAADWRANGFLILAEA